MATKGSNRLIQWIQTAQQLHILLSTLEEVTLNQPYIALDTEFVRTSHFYAAPGLLQIAWKTRTGTEIKLIDISTLKASKVAHFVTQLYAQCEKNHCILIMHAPSEDFQLFDIFEISRTCLPTLLDTQIAACYLNLKQQIGLFDLAEKILDIPTKKSHAHSNWIQRPLSWAQMSYAANDVRLLITLAPVIIQSLKQELFYKKVLEDCKALYQTEPLTLSSFPYSSQQSELGKVQPQLQARLAQLFNWREAAIRMLDIPRKWLLSNKALAHICTLGDLDSPPKVQLIMNQVFRDERKSQQLNLHTQSKDNFLKCLEIQELHDQFYLAWQDLHPYPSELIPILLSKKSKLLLKTLEDIAKKEAQQQSMPHHAFIKRSWLKRYILSYAQKKLGKKYSVPPILTGWRQDFTAQIEVHTSAFWPYHIQS